MWDLWAMKSQLNSQKGHAEMFRGRSGGCNSWYFRHNSIGAVDGTVVPRYGSSLSEDYKWNNLVPPSPGKDANGNQMEKQLDGTEDEDEGEVGWNTYISDSLYLPPNCPHSFMVVPHAWFQDGELTLILGLNKFFCTNEILVKYVTITSSFKPRLTNPEQWRIHGGRRGRAPPQKGKNSLDPPLIQRISRRPATNLWSLLARFKLPFIPQTVAPSANALPVA